MGGLGNQLFQIFTTIAYSLEHSCPFIFLNQFQLSSGSNGETIRYSYWNTFLKALQPFLRDNIFGFELYKEPNYSYTMLTNNLGKVNNTVLVGYFQSYKYFEKYKATITRLLKIPTLKADLLQINNTIKQIDFKNAVSMHFRLGDYKLLSDQYIILPINYYKNALLHILNNNSNTNKIITVIYFCEQSELTEVNNMINLLQKDNQFTEYKLDFIRFVLDDWQELLLMSCCQYNIIANSTFSWWGAYLSSNTTVCYPFKWFGQILAEKNNTGDLFPPTWNCISF